MNLPPAARGGLAPASLRRTLLVWLLAPLVVLVPLVALAIHALALQPALDSLDHALTDTAVALDSLFETRDGEPVLNLSEQTSRALRADMLDDVYFVAANGRGQVLAGEPALMRWWPRLAAGEWRFFDGELVGREMRIAAHGVACGEPRRVCAVLVAESHGKRQRAEQAAVWAAFGAAAALALVLLALALWAVHRALRPLQRAAGEVASRSLARLEPIDASAVPGEVRPFVLALNDLFARLRQAADAQRSFVDQASHQLRTPLATLLSESTQLLDEAHPPALQARLQGLHAAAERGARMTRQLLTLAHTDGAVLHGPPSAERVDLAALATDLANDWLQPSLDAGQDLGFELTPVVVQGNRLLLREMLGNLIHNAIVHAGAGATVTVRTAVADPHACLVVEDDGVGSTEPQLARLWGRFQRGPEATSGSGTGLGLAIVGDIARLHGGVAELARGPGGRGLQVRIRLPLAPAADPADAVV